VLSLLRRRRLRRGGRVEALGPARDLVLLHARRVQIRR
jgi:hypothetical protein